MGKLFGTDGIRGVVGENLTADLAFRTGKAIAAVLKEEKGRKPVITIGKDTRISSDMLESALIAGICSVGGDVMPFGVLPTPAVAYLTVLKGRTRALSSPLRTTPTSITASRFSMRRGISFLTRLKSRWRRKSSPISILLRRTARSVYCATGYVSPARRISTILPARSRATFPAFGCLWTARMAHRPRRRRSCSDVSAASVTLSTASRTA